MRRGNYIVFDDYIPAGTDTSNPVFSSTELNARNGQCDQLAFQVCIDNVSGATVGGFDLYMEHSADGRHFVVSKSGVANPPPSGKGDISITSALSTTTANVAWGANDGSMPFLGQVRFRLFFTNKQTAAHVRVYVTQRDQGT